MSHQLSHSSFRVIKPLDILMLRGNQAFGDAGQHASSSMPPNPSVIAGALRGFWLMQLEVDFKKFSDQKNPAKPEDFDEPVRSQLGTPNHPQGFRLQHNGLVRKVAGKFERLFAIPSDIVIQKATKDAEAPDIYSLKPNVLADGLLSNLKSEQQVPILKAPAGKPESAYWLTEQGFNAYLQGQKPEFNQLVKSSELWKQEVRLGIALESQARTASDGQIYSTEAIALQKDVYLLAEIQGSPNFPEKGNLRLGGDGRGAAFFSENLNPLKTAQVKNGKIKLLLTSPAIFSQGWKLPTQDDKNYIHFHGGSAHVVTASVPRHQVVSGWDLAKWQPKPAERVTPTGSVYWLENVQFDGDAASLQSALQALLLSDTDPQRQAEGYNACILANWIES